MKRFFPLILMFVLVLILGSCKSKQKVVAITGADIDATEQTSRAKETVKNEKEAVLEQNQVARDERFNLAEGEMSSDAVFRSYHVVVGSFGVRDNAKRLQRTLIDEGDNALVVINEQGMYRVIVASFDEYSDARDRINRISSRFPDAWVLRRK